MGIYDRDYVREDESSSRFAGPQSVVVTLIIINAAVFLAEVLGMQDGLIEYFALPSNWIGKVNIKSTNSQPIAAIIEGLDYAGVVAAAYSAIPLSHGGRSELSLLRPRLRSPFL